LLAASPKNAFLVFGDRMSFQRIPAGGWFPDETAQALRRPLMGAEPAAYRFAHESLTGPEANALADMGVVMETERIDRRHGKMSFSTGRGRPMSRASWED
jgi:hypothetical protein